MGACASPCQKEIVSNSFLLQNTETCPEIVREVEVEEDEEEFDYTTLIPLIQNAKSNSDIVNVKHCCESQKIDERLGPFQFAEMIDYSTLDFYKEETNGKFYIGTR